MKNIVYAEILLVIVVFVLTTGAAKVYLVSSPDPNKGLPGIEIQACTLKQGKGYITLTCPAAFSFIDEFPYPFSWADCRPSILNTDFLSVIYICSDLMFSSNLPENVWVSVSPGFTETGTADIEFDLWGDNYHHSYQVALVHYPEFKHFYSWQDVPVEYGTVEFYGLAVPGEFTYPCYEHESRVICTLTDREVYSDEFSSSCDFEFGLDEIGQVFVQFSCLRWGQAYEGTFQMTRIDQEETKQ